MINPVSTSILSPIYLIEGQGVNSVCLDYTEIMFKAYVNPIIKIDYSYLAKELDIGTLVFSGGNSHTQLSQICKAADRAGLMRWESAYKKLVRDHVQNGCNYIGICAGAFTGSRPNVSIVNTCYLDFKSADQQKLKIKSIFTDFRDGRENLKNISVAHFGGPEFIDIDGSNTYELAFFTHNQTTAIVRQDYRQSQALLMSYHPEFSTKEFLNQNDLPSGFRECLDPSITKEEFFSALRASQSKVESFTAACFATLNIQKKSSDEI